MGWKQSVFSCSLRNSSSSLSSSCSTYPLVLCYSMSLSWQVVMCLFEYIKWRTCFLQLINISKIKLCSFIIPTKILFLIKLKKSISLCKSKVSISTCLMCCAVCHIRNQQVYCIYSVCTLNICSLFTSVAWDISLQRHISVTSLFSMKYPLTKKDTSVFFSRPLCAERFPHGNGSCGVLV